LQHPPHIVHDVDNSFLGAETLSQIEESMGVKSSFYLRATQNYFEQSMQYFQSLEKKGFEIGLHYNCLSRTNNVTFALQLLEAQILFMRRFYDITTVRASGDVYNLSINNRDLWRYHREVYNKLGVVEAEGFQDTYLCDTGGKWQIPEEKLWGDVLLLNFHADYWG